MPPTGLPLGLARFAAVVVGGGQWSPYDYDICDKEFDGDATNPQEGGPHRRHLSSPPHLANDGIGGDVYLWCGKGWVGLCLPFPRVQPPEDEDG